MWNIYEIIHICTAVIDESEVWFEPMTSAIPVRCSTNWAMKPHIGSKVNLLSSYLPVQWNHVKYIWNNSYLYCGSRWKKFARIRIPLKPWFFFRLLLSNCLNWKIYCDDHTSLSSTTAVQILENLLRWSHFTFISPLVRSVANQNAGVALYH